MSLTFSQPPNFINLQDAGKNIKYWKKRAHYKQVYNFTSSFRGYVHEIDPTLSPYDLLGTPDKVSHELLVCLTKKVAEIALKYDLVKTKQCEIDIKTDLWMSKEAQNIMSKANYLDPSIKKPIMELANAIKFIFLQADCKAELNELEDTCKLKLFWNNANIFNQKYEIVCPWKNQFEHLNDLRKSNELVDGTLEVEGHSIPIHRCILAAKSPVFRAIFTNSMKESVEKKTGLSDEKLSTINLFLDYVYRGFVILDDMNLNDILALTRFAHQYQIDDLFDGCNKLLHEQVIIPENIIDVYLFSEEIDSKRLMSSCRLYCANNREICDQAMDVSAITNVDQLTKISHVAKKLDLKGLMKSIEEELLKRAS